MKKIAFITGGSSGIGAAISQKLLKLGCKVFVVSRQASKSHLAKQKNCTVIDADLTQISAAAKIIKNKLAKEKINSIDILINCAGIGYGTPLKNLDEKTYDSFMNTNVKSVFFFTKNLLPFLKKNSIICNVSSIAGIKGFSQWSTYCASKFALEGFTKSLREELRERGIKVMIVRPGAVDTPLYDFLKKSEKKDFMKPETIADIVVPNFFLEDNATTEEIFINNSVGDV